MYEAFTKLFSITLKRCPDERPMITHTSPIKPCLPNFGPSPRNADPMKSIVRFVTTLVFALVFVPHVPTLADSLAGKRPNILFVLTDDQGYGDISAHGNPVLKTPNLDKLRSEGVRFTDFHVSPTCSPTRSALMTGRHEFKNGVTHTILERERLTLNATTIAQVLQANGYTTGIFGKWHLGDEAEYQPNHRGFDEVYIHGGGGVGQIYPGSCGDAPGNKYFNPTLLHNGKFEKTQGYCADLYFEQATKWMDAQRSAKKPFFAYIPSNTPHGPYIAKPEDRTLYEGKDLGEATENFFGMLHNIDQNVGKLLTKLDEWGIAKDTLVIFMNDNGGTAGVKVFNADMRGSKGSPWIGGTRANSFWRWKGTIQPADCKALAAHIDFFPTLASISGSKIPDAAKSQVEGRSLVPLLENPNANWEDRYLISHQGRWPKFADPNASKFRMCSVRNTRFQLVSENGAAEPKWQLFDLRSDYSQTTDVAAQHPEVVKELAAAFDKAWSESLPLMVNEKAVGPAINPFQELYYKQFGGSPTPEDLAKMDPNRKIGEGAPKNARKNKTK
jgi:arylsulfatase